MMPKFLLDTNVVSEPIKPKPNNTLMKRLKQHEDELAISAVVWHELNYGCNRLPASKKRDSITLYLAAIDWLILPYDADAAHWHAAERARLTELGRTPSFQDGQIAAVAATQDLILVTFNLDDFTDFKGLKLADWRH